MKPSRMGITRALALLLDPIREYWKKPKSGEQNCRKQKLLRSDKTRSKSPLSGTEKRRQDQGTSWSSRRNIAPSFRHALCSLDLLSFD
jgi:hypothetical protein